MAETNIIDENKPFGTQFHKDGTVTIWNVYTQTWQRTDNPEDRVLASLGHETREAVLRHCKIGEQCDVDSPETEEDCRKRFEKWASDYPRNRSIKRVKARLGCVVDEVYDTEEVEMAWQAWYASSLLR